MLSQIPADVCEPGSVSTLSLIVPCPSALLNPAGMTSAAASDPSPTRFVAPARSRVCSIANSARIRLESDSEFSSFAAWSWCSANGRLSRLMMATGIRAPPPDMMPPSAAPRITMSSAGMANRMPSADGSLVQTRRSFSAMSRAWRISLAGLGRSSGGRRTRGPARQPPRRARAHQPL